jgi:tRNA A37 N6-isopentenylltransferase MiaA
MDIGTAKPDAATLARFPHRLIDLITPFAPEGRRAMLRKIDRPTSRQIVDL